MRRRIWAAIKLEWPVAAALVVAVVIWQLASEFGLISSFLLPAPSQIAYAFLHSRVNWLANTLVTLNEILVGFAFGALTGVGIAILVALSPLARRIVMPYVVATQVVPMVAVAPIIYIVLGFNNGARCRPCDSDLLLPDRARHGERPDGRGQEPRLSHEDARRGQLQDILQGPPANSLPHMFVGFRIGITGATIGAVIAEFVSSNSGLGFLITTTLTNFNTTLSFVAIVILTVLGLLLVRGGRIDRTGAHALVQEEMRGAP